MEKDYKAIEFTLTTHHKEVIDDEEPWNNREAYDTYQTRFCIVSLETGEVLDDAQGYGYKTAQKAYAAYAYKTRDKQKVKESENKIKHIKAWMKENKSFVNLMDEFAFQVAKGSLAPDEKFDAKFVNQLLKEHNLEPDFTANDLLKVWKGKR
jgi:hypothetical protein